MFVNTTIRRCMVSDAPRIYALCKSELGYDFTLEQIEANIRRQIGTKENLLLVVADQEDNAIAFIHAGNHDPVYAPPMKDIMALAVDPAYRKAGLGTQLIRAVEEWAVSTGAAGVRVNSGIEQENAVVFYKSLGYSYIKTVYNFRKMF